MAYNQASSKNKVFMLETGRQLSNKMSSEDDFNKITSAINEEYENLVQNVAQVPHIADLKHFYSMYEKEEKSIEQKYATPSKVPPTIEDFAAAFKQFDEYPANLQKPKKPPPMRERLNSTISKSSPSLNDSSTSSSAGSTNQQKETSLSLLNLNKLDDVPSASKTLASFVKFQKNLKQLNADIIQQDVDKEYAVKLKQLNLFAQQLEKLLPTEKVGKSALTTEEEQTLEDLVNRMDDLNFIRGHQDVFRQQNSAINSVAPKLENLVDILSYCLLAVNSFNTN